MKATAMLIDIRNFTPNLRADRDGKFREFVTDFLNKCFLCIQHACNVPSGEMVKNVYINSTGDGLLAIFHSGDHAKEALLTAILIYNKMEILCRNYNKSKELDKGNISVSYGIGIDTGSINRIQTKSDFGKSGEGLFIQTYLGNTINVAARIQDKTKDFDDTRMVMTENTNEILYPKYKTLIKELNETDSKNTKERTKIRKKMDEINEKYFIEYIFWHKLKGVKKPICLYRMVNHLASTKHIDFRKHIKNICKNEEHIERIELFLRKRI